VDKTKEWKKKLHHWRQMQQSKGVIKSMDQTNQGGLFESVTTSVLAILQSTISLKSVKKSVETVYLNSTQRVAGLKLIGKLMNLELVRDHAFDIVNWFCASLRGNQNSLGHYLDDIRGCGKLLEQQARVNFFIIIKGLLKRLVKSKNDAEIKLILNSLKWDYSGNDHKFLHDLRIFRVLRDGEKESEKLKGMWGSAFKYQFAQGEEKQSTLPVELSKEVLDLFEFMLIISLGRSLKPEGEVQKIKMAQTKMSVMPALERIESKVDADVTL